MGRFFTDPQGRVRPITGGKAGAAVVAAVMTGALAVGGGGLGGGASVGGTTSAAGAADSAALRSLRTRTSSGQRAARKGQYEAAWQRMGLRTLRRSAERKLECAVHSFGEVREFFWRTPCRSLERALLVLSDADGDTIVVSVAWVRMPTTKGARQLKPLVDTYGTGNVSPLAGEVLELRGIQFTGQHYASRRNGPMVVIAEAEPVAGTTDDDVLDGVAEVAVEFPPL